MKIHKNQILKIDFSDNNINFTRTCSVRVESKTMLVDSGRGAFQICPSISASIDGTTMPVSGATVGALNAYSINRNINSIANLQFNQRKTNQVVRHVHTE